MLAGQLSGAGGHEENAERPELVHFELEGKVSCFHGQGDYK